jgi:hypothetical protein
MRDRHTTITPAPIPREHPATIGDAMELDAQHSYECSEARQKECQKRDEDRADKDGIFWARIVAVESVVQKMETVVNGMIANARSSFKLKVAVATIVVALLGIATTAGIFVAKYAIVGAITLELDKRIPPGMHLSVEQVGEKIHYAQVPDDDR